MRILKGTNAEGTYYLQKKGNPKICAKITLPTTGEKPVVFERDIDAKAYAIIDGGIELSDAEIKRVETNLFYSYESVYLLEAADVRKLALQRGG